MFILIFNLEKIFQVFINLNIEYVHEMYEYIHVQRKV